MAADRILVRVLHHIYSTLGDLSRHVHKGASELLVESAPSLALVGRQDVPARVAHVINREVVARSGCVRGGLVEALGGGRVPCLGAGTAILGGVVFASGMQVLVELVGAGARDDLLGGFIEDWMGRGLRSGFVMGRMDHLGV
jgi:hypothetical protein